MSSCVQNHLACDPVPLFSSPSQFSKSLHKATPLNLKSNPIFQSPVKLKLNTQLISVTNLPTEAHFMDSSSPSPQKRLVVFRPKKVTPKNGGDKGKAMISREILALPVCLVMVSLFKWVQMVVLLMVGGMDTVLGSFETFIMGTIKEMLVLDFGKHKPLFTKLMKACLFMKKESELRQKRTSELKKKEMGRKERKELTLVLDLDETLVHSSMSKPLQGDYQILMVARSNGVYQQVYLKKRPHLEQFLDAVSEEYNITIFTASYMEYADIAISLIDRNCVVSKRFYRHSCEKTPAGWTKNLEKVHPDMTKVILLDDSNVAGSIQPDNHLLITAWKDDENDKCLLDFAEVLVGYANQWKLDNSEGKDLRNYIKEFKDKNKIDEMVTNNM